MDRLRASDAAGGGHRAAYDDLLDGRWFVLDSLGRVSRWSEQAQAVFGWAEDEVTGRSAFVPPLSWSGAATEEWRLRLEAGEPLPMRSASVTVLHRDALELPTDLTIVPVPLALGFEFTALMGDLADRRRGSRGSDELVAAHPAAAAAIDDALRDPGSWPATLAGLLVTFRPTGDAVAADDARAEDAARALRIEPDQALEEAGAAPAADAGAELDDMLRDVEALRERASEAAREAASGRSRVLELERELSELRASNATLQTELETAREAAAEALARFEGLGDPEQLLAEHEELRSAAFAAVEERNEAVARTHEAERALSVARSQLETLRVRITMPPQGSGAGAPPSEDEREPRPDLDDAGVPRAHIGLDGHFVAINREFSRLLGYSEREFRRAVWPPVIGPHSADGLHDLTGRVLSGELERAQVDAAYMHADGFLIPIVGTLSAARAPDGEPTHLVLDVNRRVADAA